MIKKKVIFLVILPLLIIIGVIFALKSKAKPNLEQVIQEIKPAIGSIQNIISTTGTVLPKNRLEIKAPVGGRLESILVKEGDKVKIGQTLAIMSSTERAALLDAAQGQGIDKLKYWQQAYKPIVLLAPIDAEVIVATMQPGQAVTTSDAIIVLSDHLIVRAQVDETDIGKIKVNQKAVVILDAYPDTKINALVEHIYYESKLVNNVTIYEVDLVPEEIPFYFRSGMSATINFIEKSSNEALLVPLEAVHEDNGESFVLIRKNGDKEPVKQAIEIGLSDDKNVEITSGVSVNDSIILTSKKYVLPTLSVGTNPLMPFNRRKARSGSEKK